jgi:hypothetical protein
MVEFLNKWQTLIGSILGGIFALAAALIVAFVIRRREEVASGMLAVSNLARVRNANEVLEKLATDKNVPAEEYHLWFSEKLAHLHPSLSTHFEAAITRLMPVNVAMAAHLSLFQTIYSETEIKIQRLAEDYSKLYKGEEGSRPKNLMEADAKLITAYMKHAVQHASCAEQLINHLVLSPYSFFNKLKQYTCMKFEDKDCTKLLKEGHS